MKKIIFIIVMILTLNTAAILLFLPASPFYILKQTVYIALAGPVNGADKENGEAMRRGAEMCLDTVRNSGRFKNKKIRILVYNDRNKRTAISIASRIADEAKAIIVLGHFDSESSLAAGSIYKKNGIPAITASATSEELTHGNEWYFRVVPGEHLISDYVAYGVRNLMGSTSSSILYDKNEYEGPLKMRYEAISSELGIRIRNKWEFDSSSDNLEHRLYNIIGELGSVDDPGTIYCATRVAEGVRFLSSCRYPGTDYSVAGRDSFATPSFISRFNDYPYEKENPGYYTDGIYAVSPFISYLADGEDARAFCREFVRKYGKEPSWVAACYYDAMRVALSAVERAEIQGQDIREDRRRVRKALAAFNEPDIAVRGITGNIYFDKEGNLNRTLFFGTWNRHRFLPAFSQYQALVPNPPKDGNTGKEKAYAEEAGADSKEAEKEMIEIQGKAVTCLRVVYAGIYMNKICIKDREKSVFEADFYLWFRFNGSFDDTRIRFDDALEPVILEKPVMEKSRDGIHTRAYRIIADFRADSDMKNYPLDRQTLRIRFSHKELTRQKLIYVPDVAELPFLNGKTDKNKMLLQEIPGWKAEDILISGDIAEMPGTGNEPLSYSRFSAEIQLQRKDGLSLLLKYIFPILTVIIMLYVTFQIPADLPGAICFVSVPPAAVLSGIRLFYGYMLPAPGIIANIFPLLYILTGMTIIISLLICILHKRKADTEVGILRRWGKILYLFTVLAGGGLLSYPHWPLIREIGFG